MSAEAVVRQILGALGERDLKGFLTVCDEDVELVSAIEFAALLRGVAARVGGAS